MATTTSDTDAETAATEEREVRRLEAVHVYRRAEGGEEAYEHVASVLPDRGISASTPDAAERLAAERERLLREAADRVAETTAYSADEAYETLRPTDVRADLIRRVADEFDGGEFRTATGGDEAPALD